MKILIKSFLLCVACFLIFTVPVFSEEMLCPPPKPLQEGQDDLRMFEKAFTLSHANSSIGYLRDDFYRIIRELQKKKGRPYHEQVNISYPNSLTFIEGTLIKQDALLLKAKAELAEEKFKNGTTSEKKAAMARQQYEGARKIFCLFIKRLEYVD